jgi:hypothetical protein
VTGDCIATSTHLTLFLLLSLLILGLRLITLLLALLGLRGSFLGSFLYRNTANTLCALQTPYLRMPGALEHVLFASATLRECFVAFAAVMVNGQQ